VVPAVYLLVARDRRAAAAAAEELDETRPDFVADPVVS
jgi:hypothetical protein